MSKKGLASQFHEFLSLLSLTSFQNFYILPLFTSLAPTYQTATSSSSTSQPAPIPSDSEPAFQTRKKNKWDSFKVEEDKEDPSNMDAFFQTLFKGADPDTQKAMMKSYQESGGTALSTNWGEVKNKKYEADPPDGMEARKYER